MQRPIHRLIRTWNRLVGSVAEFDAAHRAFNAISIFSLIILIILLPFNALIGLGPVCVVVSVLIVLQSFFYYLSRFRKKYVVSMIAYAIISYLTLILNYFFNSGSLGPTLSLFLLTFQLLIAFTPKQMHPKWAVFHLVVPLLLLLTEHYRPQWVPDSYRNNNDRFTDLLTSYTVIVIGMYLITIYLRNSYRREKKNAEERANKIEQQNRQLDQLNKEKSKLFSIISHDLRSPLNSITSVLEMLTDSDLEEEERIALKKDLLNITRSTSDMLLNLLSWSSSQLKGAGIRFKAVPVLQVVQNVLSVLNLLAEKKKISLQCDIAPDLQVLADADMLELVVRNLLNNAVKFTPEQGHISVRAYRQEEQCVIAVADNGIGMSVAQQERLFSLNVQSTYGTNNETGVGLGLLLCKEFTLAQGGTIQLESQEGRGSTFYISLAAVTDADRSGTFQPEGSGNYR